MRYAVSGQNAGAIQGASAQAPKSLLGSTITTGRVLWLRGLYVNPISSNSGYLALYDGVSSANATVTASQGVPMIQVKIATECEVTGSGIGGPMRHIVNFGEPGIRFSTGCVACFALTGTCPIGTAGGWGYEE